jgi:hypothetical protein
MVLDYGALGGLLVSGETILGTAEHGRFQYEVMIEHTVNGLPDFPPNERTQSTRTKT